MWAFYVDAAEAAPSTATITPCIPCAPPPQLVLETENAGRCEVGRDAQVLIQDMVTTSLAERASPSQLKEDSYGYEEWEGVKGTLRRASELYDGEDLSGSITLLRAVVHECHRLHNQFPDPSVFLAQTQTRRRRGRSSSSSEDAVASSSSSSRNLTIDRMYTCTNETVDSDSDSPSNPSSCRHHCHHHHHRHSRDSPTAFHAVLGVALFLFGNLIAQNSSLAISREPTAPDFYWRAALDVFDAGDNLPSHTTGNSFANPDHPDDWRLAIAWGRTLVALAYDLTKSNGGPSPPSPTSPTSPVSPSHQRFAQRSPLTAIAAMRTPGFALPTHVSAHELLTLAADQFSRGIFHMPHTPPGTPSHSHAPRAREWGSPPSPSPCGFSRPGELFTLASEVLLVAERLDGADERRRWAAWADAVFHQMHMEADVDTWRARVISARGRCWLAIGSAHADELEDALERGDRRILSSKDAEDARTALATAISFFDRAKGSASTESPETLLVDIRPLLAEALLSLANLIADEDAREALYARAKAEGGEAVARDLGPSPTRTPTTDVWMDES
ncbi:hypothetical protein EDB92DRAFT_870430 [Lactarius akahatsu]|uniref:Uncharacterized protein n=1 Tax=Lactarius akahatsu TaxID=416441 RepID=A0AAD4LFV3_9AGAM|nr:hypothetical protein EDB92DRAFT_870430 [Lactarius akahatsu]